MQAAPLRVFGIFGRAAERVVCANSRPAVRSLAGDVLRLGRAHHAVGRAHGARQRALRDVQSFCYCGARRMCPAKTSARNARFDTGAAVVLRGQGSCAGAICSGVRAVRICLPNGDLAHALALPSGSSRWIWPSAAGIQRSNRLPRAFSRDCAARICAMRLVLERGESRCRVQWTPLSRRGNGVCERF